ncbi:E3 SUMO-protein ligase PIAS4-like isoform X3 [Chiloscyllium plagiosum]|nr:E3 SUMO-protein ligase PIAS4-like isoform X3 [Chiloscyllium plagiosum]
MILGFRVSELQVLLGFAGRNKSGLKHELVSRALQLVRNNCSSEILKKIQDLHAHRYSTRSSNAQCQQLPPAPTFPLHSSEAALNARTSVPNCHTGKADTKSKVRLTKLPFYEILDDLMKPTDLVPTTSERIQENQFSFTLTDKQREQIISGCSKNGVQSIQVQLRICHSDTEFIQDDQYPPYLSIKVNSRVCPFTSYFSSNKPGVEPKRPCRPIDITPLLNLTSRGANYLNIFWGHFAKRYSVVLYLVKQHIVAELLHKLQANETRASEISRELIRKKLRLEPDNDVTTTGLRVSLMCSLGKMRLSVPCRGITCTHLQCFDAALYIQMNEKKPTWMCPVCDKPAPYELLFVDQLFLDILKECEDATEVQFKDDGSWIPIKPDKQPQKNSGPQYSIVELEECSCCITFTCSCCNSSRSSVLSSCLWSSTSSATSSSSTSKLIFWPRVTISFTTFTDVSSSKPSKSLSGTQSGQSFLQAECNIRKETSFYALSIRLIQWRILKWSFQY